MLNAELAGWLVMFLAAAVLAGFLLEEWLRYVHRAHNLSRLFASFGAEERPVHRSSEAGKARTPDQPRSAVAPPVSRARPAAPPGTVAEGRR